MKAELWRKTLVDVSNIARWEPKNVTDGHESQFIKKVVDTILDRLFPFNSCVDGDLVGMRTRFQDLKSLLHIDSVGVRMVGIWGVGGGGKTTLASSIYMDISQHFQGHCIIENVREETTKYGLIKVQERILSALFKEEVKVNSVVEGKHMMKSMLCHRSMLVVLDDVDKLDQLEALAGKHNWFGSGSRIIITTRDKHLLKTHKVNHVYPVNLLSHDEAIWLFKRHAYNEEDPIEDYETLSISVVSYCSGLPLAIKVLGSSLYDKNKTEWMSFMDQLKDIPETEIVEKLKISFNGLKTAEKELFLDISCFFRWANSNNAMEMLEACGYHPKIGIKVLIEKALIMIVYGRFDLHGLVQEMGHYIVRGKHPNNPEKHSRLWNHKEIKTLPFHDEEMKYDKIKAIVYRNSSSMNIVSRDHDESSCLFKIVSNMKNLRLLIVSPDNDSDENAEAVNFISNDLRYIEWSDYPAIPFPHSFQPVKRVVLKLFRSMQKEVWKGYKHMPCLRVLELGDMKKLLGTPDFDGFPCLQKLTLCNCMELEEIHPSLGNHTTLEYLHVRSCEKLKRIPTSKLMKNIKTLRIMWCYLKDGEVPCGIGELSNLQEPDLSGNDFSRLDFILSHLTRLLCFNVSNCYKLLELPELPSSLAILNAYDCESLTVVEDFNKDCKELCQVKLDTYGWGDILLQSMLKGNTIENDSMHLQVDGVEIPKGFTPPLRRGSRCRLKLQENWCNDISGFLICAIIRNNLLVLRTSLSMKRVLSGSDFEDDAVWEETDGYGERYATWVWYVSFGSLRHTTWWDQTYNELCFNIKESEHHECIGFGVGLVDKKTTNSLTETSTCTSSPYTPTFKITHDSSSELRADLVPYQTY